MPYADTNGCDLLVGDQIRVFYEFLHGGIKIQVLEFIVIFATVDQGNGINLYNRDVCDCSDQSDALQYMYVCDCSHQSGVLQCMYVCM